MLKSVKTQAFIYSHSFQPTNLYIFVTFQGNKGEYSKQKAKNLLKEHNGS